MLRRDASQSGRSNSDKSQFLEQTKVAREERAKKLKHQQAAIKIQAHARKYLSRQRFLNEIRSEYDKVLSLTDEQAEYKAQYIPATDVFCLAKRYLMFCCQDGVFSKRIDCLCKYILYSLSSDVIKMSYLSVLLNKQLSVSWIVHIKQLLTLCLKNLNYLKPENSGDLRAINTILTMLISFTSTTNWKILSVKTGDILRPAMNQMCINIMNHLVQQQFFPTMETLLFGGLARTKPSFKTATLTAICTLILRFLQTSGHSETCTREFLLHVFSVPGLLYHVEVISNDIYTHYVADRVFCLCLQYLSQDDQLQAIAVTLEGNRTVCLLANLIQLGISEMEGVVNNLNVFMSILTKLLEVCGQFMMGKKTNKSHWHPILGWASHPFNYNEAVPYILKQLQILWSHKTVNLLFAEMNELAESTEPAKVTTEDKKTSLLKKKADKKPTSSSKIVTSTIRSTIVTCVMYQTAINVLVQLQTELLAGLAFHAKFLSNLWTLTKNLGSSTNQILKVFLESLSSQMAGNISEPPVTALLSLFCDASIMLFMILDDVEMYESQKPFSLDDLMMISDLLNQLIFKIIWQDIIEWRQAENISLFNASHSLLQLLHERDSRRQFTPASHWLIKEIRPSQFISSIDKGNRTAQFLLQKMPHIVAHKDRVVLFRKLVIDEKEALGIMESSHSTPNITFITVHRQRVLEDGYRQLASLPVLALKGIIRVKFVNEQGLDEAGIDQDGVFKEFLEETIKNVFDPGLNLFKVTAEQKLYPSPTSMLQDNHLALFEFVGRMLGKAVYEGIVVEVPFAPFFLTQVLDNMKSSMYSYLDELPSLDPELYKNLAYVKHYDGDVSDLELNFSYDEDFMGRIKNYELKPGGRAILVTNENKISYVHYMARFKMHTQIKEQTIAFIKGFKSIVNYDWLRMFSTPEVQKLISGDNVEIDLADLRKHTQYYGGFHNNHRVINWLWDILKKDFNEQERKMFLKFVTSCSKPPLLGFSQLDPPFSIRCVEVSDDQDTGDTIGSVLKGFFSIRRNEPAGRLPTSSTCFNLLKLPNYSKKSILRDKLRYSISSNTGFELS